MTRYRIWVQSSTNGKIRIDTVEGDTPAAVAEQARINGLQVHGVQAVTPGLWDTLTQPRALSGGISRARLVLLTEQLAALLEAGIEASQAVSLLGRQVPDRATRALLERLGAAIARGDAFSAGFDAESSVPDYVVEAVRSAEAAGDLALGLREASQALSLIQQTQQRVGAALAYPAIVLATTLVALWVIATSVIPEFVEVFGDDVAQLPFLTRFVVGLSQLLTERPHWLLAGTAGAVSMGWFCLRLPLVRAAVSSAGAYMPWTLIYQQYIAAGALRVLSALLRSGVPVVDALARTAQSVGDGGQRKRLEGAAIDVRSGDAVSQALAERKCFPDVAIRLLDVGEATGRLAPMAQRAADVLNTQMQFDLARMLTVLNPLAILLLGALVGLLVMGVMLGVFSVNGLVVS